MNAAASLRDAWASPVAAFVPFPDTNGYVNDETLAFCDDEPLQVSLGQVDSSAVSIPPFDDTGEMVQWRIDGATAFGTVYFATPYSFAGPLSSLAPKAVSVQIPDQLEWPADLRNPLDASKSAHMMDARSKELGITKHLHRALEYWSHHVPNFEKKYLSLPYGSTIKVRNIAANVADMAIDFVPKPKLVQRMLTLDALQAMWKFPPDILPKAISLDILRFKVQLEKSILLVDLPQKLGGNPVIFKTRPASMRALYHEIKTLCTIPPHPTIIKKPLYLVHTPCPETNDDRVCGFILEYHEKGALQDILPQRLLNNTLPMQDRILWAVQLTTALIHVKESSPDEFYSDLKMDNVLLSTRDGVESVVLVDFEQSRNIFACAPPESYLIDWLYELADSPSIGKEFQDRFAAMLRTYLEPRGVRSPLDVDSSIYDNAPHGYYYPWLALNPSEREAGMVFCLGKALWCIFEGASQVCNIIGRSAMLDTWQEFPEFRQTPEQLRDLIKRCTSGAREWSTGPLAIFRKGSKIYPRGKAGMDGQPTATIDETKIVIKETWQAEVDKIIAFVEAKNRQFWGESIAEDNGNFGYLERPKLREVLEVLRAFRPSDAPAEKKA